MKQHKVGSKQWGHGFYVGKEKGLDEGINIAIETDNDYFIYEYDWVVSNLSILMSHMCTGFFDKITYNEKIALAKSIMMLTRDKEIHNRLRRDTLKEGKK